MMFILQQYGFAEQAAGNIKTARDMNLERLRIQNSTDVGRGWYFNIYSNLGIVQARLGNTTEAQSALSSMERVLQDSSGWRNLQPHNRDDWYGQVLRTRAALAQETGRYADA